MNYEDRMVEILENYGIATSKAMPIFLDDNSYYIKTMKAFIEENELLLLDACVKNQEMEDALSHAYNLTALTGSLGFEQAYQVSRQLCEYISRQDLNNILEKIEWLKSFFYEIRNLLEQQEV